MRWSVVTAMIAAIIALTSVIGIRERIAIIIRGIGMLIIATSSGTLVDYRKKPQPRELCRFDDHMVNTITRNEMAEAIAAVHQRGAEAMAEGMVRTIRRFCNWLAEAVRQDQTNGGRWRDAKTASSSPNAS